MAEIYGLMIGTVALASLFSTCIELFDKFQLGKDHIRGFDSACIKIDLLKTRLERWREDLNCSSFCDPEWNDPASQRVSTGRYDVVARSLIGIRDILESTSSLQERYRPPPRQYGPAFTSSALFRRFHRNNDHDIDDTLLCSESTTPRVPKYSHGRLSLRKRTLWAVHGKQKFDELIQDLSFLVENLEKTNHSRISWSIAETLAVMGDSNSATCIPMKSQTAQMQTYRAMKAAEEARQLTKHFKPPQAQVDKTAETIHTATYDNVYTGSQQINKSGFGVMGNIGDEANGARNSYSGGQYITDGSSGVMGNVSNKAWEQHQSRSKAV